MKRVRIHIERLVLAGVRPEDRHALAEGLRQELGRVFSSDRAGAHLSTLGAIARLHVRGVAIDPGSTPQRAGAQVAQGIGREIAP